MNNHYVEIDWYFCGVHQGKRRIHRDSMVGKLLQGNMFGALKKAQAIQEEVQQTLSNCSNEKEGK